MAKDKPTLTVAQQEAALKAQLAELAKNRREREVIEALDAGWVAQGVRLVPPRGGEEGRTLALSSREAALLNKTLQEIAASRIPAES